MAVVSSIDLYPPIATTLSSGAKRLWKVEMPVWLEKSKRMTAGSEFKPAVACLVMKYHCGHLFYRQIGNVKKPKSSFFVLCAKSFVLGQWEAIDQSFHPLSM